MRTPVSAQIVFVAVCAIGCADGTVDGPDGRTVDARADRPSSADAEPTDVEDRDSDPEPPLPDASAMDASVEDVVEPVETGVAMDVASPRDTGVDAGAPRDSAPDGPTGRPVVRTIGYRMATYTMRNNWVHDCTRGYAFTARGAEHIPNDCDMAYRPDGTLRGTATFTFNAVIVGNYNIEVSSRFSANRDAAGALFIVNGERFTLDQRPGSTIVTSTLARRALGGTVTVVLDNSRGGGSDSVQSVTLRPAP
jgi:hypothetical protein